jgi:hypothetical protein
MTKTKNLSDRAVKISISLDPELIFYLDQLEGTRSSNIAKAIEVYRRFQRQTNYARIVRNSFEKRIEKLI